MFASKLSSKLLVTYAAVVIVCIAALAVPLHTVLRQSYVSRTVERFEEGLAARAGDLRRAAEQDDAELLDAICGELNIGYDGRVSIIDDTGELVADSISARCAARARPECRQIIRENQRRMAEREMPLRDTVTVRLPLDLGTMGPGTVRLALPLEPVKRQLRQVYILLLLSGVTATALASAAGLVISRRIVRPVETMTTMAERIAAGDFDYRIPVSRHPSDEIGRLAGALQTMRGALRKNLEDIRRERDQAMAIVQNMSDGVISLDGSGRVVFANAAASAMLQIRERLNENTPLTEVPIADTLQEAIAVAGAAGTEQTVEFGDGGRGSRVIRCTVTPVGARAGRREPGIVLVLRDMTEARRAERMGKELVANASHELRTPIAIIGSTADTLLAATPENTPNREFLDIIARNAQRMSRLVGETLQLSQLDGADHLGPWENIRVEDWVDDCLEQLQPLARERGVALLPPRGQADATVYGVYSLLIQALRNLIDNAVRHAAAGTVAVSWSMTATTLAVTVRDTGPGIAPADRDRIFDRFVRGPQTQGDGAGAGTGLGLAIVNRVTEIHRGRVVLDSVLGRGSAFTLILPLHPRERAPDAAARETAV